MARYTVERNYVQVLGKIWMPFGAIAALEIQLSDNDIESIRDDDGDLTRSGVDQWLASHSGDFSSIVDFNASIGDWECGWMTEENEMQYFACLSGEE